MFVRGWLCIEAHGNYFSNQDHGNDMAKLEVCACLSASMTTCTSACVHTDINESVKE